MNKTLTSLLCCLLVLLYTPRAAKAQQYLRLDYKCEQPLFAFSKVHIIDKRVENQMVGFVQKGAFNRLEKIVFNGSLADSLGLFFQKKTATRKSGKALVFVLQDLFMSEQTGGFSETGRLKISGRLFLQQQDGTFAGLFTMDSTIVCSGMDVTQKMLRSVSKYFCFLAANIINCPVNKEEVYSLDDLYHLDSLELQQIPIFVNKPVAGVYKSYQSFKMNTPDIPGVVGIEDKGPGKISAYLLETTRRNKTRKIWLAKETVVYAASDGERIIKRFDGKCYEIKKADFGFYFDCPAAFSNNAAMWGGAIGGMAGAALASSINTGNRKLYRFKINPRTGRSIPMMPLAKESDH
jgi:hypothetical protein